MNKKKKRLIIWGGIILVLAVAAFFVIRSMNAAKAALESMTAVETYTVERGTVASTITASGSLSADDTEKVELPGGLKLSDIAVVAGDAVSAGDVLCTVDSESIYQQLIYEARQLAAADNRFSGTGTNDTVVSPCKARVKYIAAKEGDDALTVTTEAGGLAVLSTDGWMRLDLAFEDPIVIGERVSVSWDGGSTKGTVSRKTAAGYSILLPDAHAPYKGKASAAREDGKVLGSGVLEINMPLAVYGYAGTIEQVKCHIDESVPNGRVLFQLKNYPNNTGFDLRYGERANVAKLYEKLLQLFNDPRVLAPVDGIVSELSISEDEKVGKADAADKLFTAVKLSVGGATKLSVTVDELDIANVLDGQEASVSFDALPDEAFTGTVTRVTKLGKKENSISVYPVELTIPADDRLLSGMNGTAKIGVAVAENVLTIPVDAIGEDAAGAYVMVRTAAGTTERRAIETGLSDGTTAEVTSGLSEGDVIEYALPGIDLSSMMAGMGMGGTVAVSTTEE